MHDDPGQDRVKERDERGLVAAAAEIRPDRGEQYAPRNGEEEMDGSAEEIRPDAERVLYALAEHEAGRVAGNARKRHEMLGADPDERLVNPDDHRARQAAGYAGAQDCAERRLAVDCRSRPLIPTLTYACIAA